eukprot:Colp12_sorted_trinity150504_noHs@10067
MLPKMLNSQLTRFLPAMGFRAFASKASPKKERLIILGSGWAGFKVIQHIDLKLYEVYMISPRNHWICTPLLASTTVGTLDFRNVTEPIRAVRREAQFYQAQCQSINFEERLVTCRSNFWHSREEFLLRYDKLVIATGAVPNTFNIPGVHEHCFFLKEASDARKIRQRVIDCFEEADQPQLSDKEKQKLLSFVIVGGGPTGVEFAAELHDFAVEDLCRLYPHLQKHFSIKVLEAGPDILGTFSKSLREYAGKRFARDGIEVRRGTPVTHVRDGEMTLKDGSSLDFGLAVWSTGLSPSPLIRSLELPKINGRLATDNFLRVPALKGEVYAIGDCATIEGNDLPATAQVANQKGKYLAKALNQLARGKEPAPFSYRHMGMMTYVGGYRALMDASGEGGGF